jgi:hypothetical protein
MEIQKSPLGKIRGIENIIQWIFGDNIYLNYYQPYKIQIWLTIILLIIIFYIGRNIIFNIKNKT